MTTFRKPCNLYWKQLQVGDTAHDFSLTATDLFKENSGWLCWRSPEYHPIYRYWCLPQLRPRRFNQELSDLDNTVVITVSVDLPFAQGKWCAAEGIENAIMLSDYFDHFSAVAMLSSSMNGTFSPRSSCLDENNTVTYAEYVGQHQHRAWSSKQLSPQLRVYKR